MKSRSLLILISLLVWPALSSAQPKEVNKPVANNVATSGKPATSDSAMMPYGMADRVATNESRQMIPDHHVSSARKRSRAMACSLSGCPAVIRLRR